MATAPALPGKAPEPSEMGGYTVDLSKKLLTALLTEVTQLAGISKPPRQTGGLLFGRADAPVLRLDHLHKLEVDETNGTPSSADEPLHSALRAQVSGARLNQTADSAMLGWYVIRPQGEPGLGRADIDLYNELFQNPAAVMLIARPAVNRQFAVEIYSAKHGTKLSKDSHCSALWTTVDLNTADDPVSLTLNETATDETFLNVYKTADSIDRSEVKGGALAVARRYAFRFTAVLGGERIPKLPDTQFGASVKDLWQSMSGKLSPLATPSSVAAHQWTLPSKALAVRMDEQVMRSLRQTVILEQLRHPHSACGGLLLGIRSSSPGRHLTVLRHIPVQDWDLSRGGAPFLTEAQSRNLKAIAQWPSELQPLGFYRTHQESYASNSKAPAEPQIGTELAEADKLLIFSGLTAESLPGMIVRIDARTLTTSVAVLWEDGTLFELSPAQHALAPPSLPEANGGPVAVTTSIVPGPSSPLSTQSFGDGSRPAGESTPIHGSGLRAATWVLGTIVVSLCTYICAHLFLKPMLLKLAAESQNQGSAASGHDTSTHLTLPASTDGGLSLKIHPNSDAGFDISWDPHSPAVQSAFVGSLWITDGAHLSRTMHLSPDDLRSGHILYIRVGPDLTFHLQVADKAGHETEQWVRVISDTAPESRGRFHEVTSTPPPRSDREIVGSGTSTDPGYSSDASMVGSRSARSVELSPGARQLEKAAEAVRPIAAHPSALVTQHESPSLDLSTTAPGYVQELINSVALPIPPKPQPPATGQTLAHTGLPSTAKRLVASPPRVLSQYVPSSTIHTDKPVNVAVPVLVQISPSGTVVNATVTNLDQRIPRDLVDFSLKASQRWRFVPATLNGSPVSSSMVIQFRFTPPKR